MDDIEDIEDNFDMNEIPIHVVMPPANQPVHPLAEHIPPPPREIQSGILSILQRRRSRLFSRQPIIEEDILVRPSCRC